MTKYSGEFKVDIVNEYRLGQTSFETLAKKYHVGKTMIHDWANLAESQGLKNLQVKKRHKTYSLEEKLAVVDYYQTHDEGGKQGWP